MVILCIVNSRKKEMAYMESCAHKLIFQLTDESCSYELFDNADRAEEYVESHDSIAIAVLDITIEGGLELAKSIRRKFSDAFLLLIANAEISPQSYLCPSIMAGSLLLRPISSGQVDQVFGESFKSYFKKFYSETGENSYVIKSKEGRTLVDYGSINYFESREKRIVLCTDRAEYYFYDTIEKLESVLPDGFVRCHRSFIVNMGKVKKLRLSENCVLLENGCIVPVSRSYKSELKERLNK